MLSVMMLFVGRLDRISMRTIFINLYVLINSGASSYATQEGQKERRACILKPSTVARILRPGL